MQCCQDGVQKESREFAINYFDTNINNIPMKWSTYTCIISFNGGIRLRILNIYKNVIDNFILWGV